MNAHGVWICECLISITVIAWLLTTNCVVFYVARKIHGSVSFKLIVHDGCVSSFSGGIEVGYVGSYIHIIWTLGDLIRKLFLDYR